MLLVLSRNAFPQADLSLRWAHSPFCWFCCAQAHLCSNHKNSMDIEQVRLILEKLYDILVLLYDSRFAPYDIEKWMVFPVDMETL